MNLEQVVESLLFASHDPITTKAIVKVVKKVLRSADEDQREALGTVTEKEVAAAIDHLNVSYKRQKRAFVLNEGPVGWKVYTRPEFAVWVKELFPGEKPERLSPPALETLAIIAYRQPITRADIEAVRGVNVDAVLQKLIDRGLAHIAGRADLPGRPLLYETTEAFLEHFGIKDLEGLPNAIELRRVEIPTAEPAAAEGENGEAAASPGEDEAPVEKQLGLAAAVEAGAEVSAESEDEGGESEEDPADVEDVADGNDADEEEASKVAVSEGADR